MKSIRKSSSPGSARRRVRPAPPAVRLRAPFGPRARRAVALVGALAAWTGLAPAAATGQEVDPAAAGEGAVEFLGTGGPYPFSEAVRVGGTLYLSGAIGLDPATGQLAPGGIQAETRQTLENIRATLERYGSSMDRVFKCTAMLADMSEWPAMNEVWAETFARPYPARSAFGATGLALGARVEIECFATVEDPGAPGR